MTRTSDNRAWQLEYEAKGIPSSFSEGPSGAVVQLLDYIAKTEHKAKYMLDVGCGYGRNSIFFASRGYDVTAFDFEEKQVAKARKRAKKCGLENLEFLVADVREDWPVEPCSIDIVFDTFCFKHQIELDEIQEYLNHLWCSLRPGGLFMISLAARADSYYAPQRVDDSADRFVVLDRKNSIYSVLYDELDLLSLMSRYELMYFQRKEKTSLMHGSEYHRSTLTSIFRKPRSN